MAIYLDNRQRTELARTARHWLWRTELPTWLLIATVYATWFGVAIYVRQLGLLLACVLLTLCTMWYLSLQHGLLYGHPTRLPWLNALLGAAPLGIWLPCSLYRRLHLRRHETELTYPDTDPKSYFLYAADWHAVSPAMRKLYVARSTLAGRMLLQPASSILAITADARAKLCLGNWRDTPMWVAHLFAVVVPFVWLQTACGLSAWLILLGVTYPALSLATIRSFQEHRPMDSHATRGVINDAGLMWRLPFFNSNYHLVHHDLPSVPWFALVWAYRRRAEDYLVRNGGSHVRGYREWLIRYALRVAVPVAHPLFHGPSDRHVYVPRSYGEYREYSEA